MPHLACRKEAMRQWESNIRHKRGEREETNKRKWAISEVSCLVPNENDTTEEEISENQVNVATVQINLANALGSGDWERGNWPKECSSISDTGFNGGLRIFDWLRKYIEYLVGFYSKENQVETRGGEC